MQLESYKVIFITIGLIGILLFASPTIGLLINTPTGEKFSELFILGQENLMNNIPFQIKVGTTYNVYIGVGNHLGASNYYTYYVKLANTTDDLPDLTLKTPSDLGVLYQSNVFLTNEQSIENPLTFKINSVSFSNDQSHLTSITINGQEFSIDKVANWNLSRKGYFYYLFVELWTFNGTAIDFHNRSVYFALNITQ